MEKIDTDYKRRMKVLFQLDRTIKINVFFTTPCGGFVKMSLQLCSKNVRGIQFAGLFNLNKVQLTPKFFFTFNENY